MLVGKLFWLPSTSVEQYIQQQNTMTFLKTSYVPQKKISHIGLE